MQAPPQQLKTKQRKGCVQMKVYKGTDKDMQCRGYKFEIGKEYTHNGEVSPCNSGFHACENPLDVLHYYFPSQESRYFEADADGEVVPHEEDSKIACSKITLTTEINLLSLVKLGIATIFERVKTHMKNNSGNRSTAATSGDQSMAATSGDRSMAATSGAQSTAVTSGNQSTAATSGYQSIAATSGYRSMAATSGAQSIAVANGYMAMARGALGSYIVLTEYSFSGKLVNCKCVKVDGKKIKPNILYTLTRGKFTEVKGNE
jgi:hypothetical protein